MTEISGQDGTNGTRFTLSHEATIIQNSQTKYMARLFTNGNESDVMSEKWDSLRDEYHNCSVYCPDKIFRLKHKRRESRLNSAGSPSWEDEAESPRRPRQAQITRQSTEEERAAHRKCQRLVNRPLWVLNKVLINIACEETTKSLVRKTLKIIRGNSTCPGTEPIPVNLEKFTIHWMLDHVTHKGVISIVINSGDLVLK